MANTGTTEFGPQIPTEIIDPLVLSYLYDSIIVSRMVRAKDISGISGLKYDFNSFAGLTAAAKVQGTDFTPAALSISEDGTVTAGEVGVAVDLSDLAVEASGVDPDAVAREIANSVAAKMEVDVCSQFADFTTTKGTTGVDLTVADFEDALLAMRQAKAPTAPPPDTNIPPDLAGYFCVLAESGVAQLQRSIRQAGLAVQSPSVERMLETFGATAAAAVRFTFLGVNVYGQDAVPTTTGDRNGAMLCPGAIGLVTKRAPRLERQRHAIGTSEFYVGSAVYGADVIKQAFGVELVHKA